MDDSIIEQLRARIAARRMLGTLPDPQPTAQALATEPRPGDAPDPVAVVHERATAALAQLEELDITVPEHATAGTRRRRNQVGHALEAARRELRRLIARSA